MIRIAVYDDNQSRRESLQALISLNEGYAYVGGFAHTANILEDVQSCRPDLILMDIEMPQADGISGVRLLRSNFPGVKIIMQTAFDDDEKVFAAIQAGAEGYILKSAGVLQIKQSIDEVMNGGASMSPSIALKVMRYFSQGHPQQDFNLSSRESEVLRHLSAGLSYKMIADQLGISYFTVNNHVKKIYEKLQVHSLGEAISIAHRQKLV